MASAAQQAMDIELFVPGRLCLLGEHADWSGSFRRFNSALRPGRTMVVGTNCGLHARVQPHPSALVLRTVTDRGVVETTTIPMQPRRLLEVAQGGGFWSYGAGVAYKVLTDYRVGGLVIDNYKSTLPFKKGLSSSAAYCVLVARAFNRVYDLKMTTRGEMEYAYQGEIVTPSRCGRMDQACAFGNRPVLMTYDGDFTDVATLRVSMPLYLVLVDLCAKKSTVEILAKLQSCFPFAQNEDQYAVQRLLGPFNEDITERAVKAMEQGRPEELGALMVEAQRAFDAAAGKVCPSQLTAPVLHKVLAHAPLKPHVYGGKGVGAGGDGTAQFLCRSAAAQQAVADILHRDFGMPCLFVTVQASSPVRTAVIPAAGFGADLWPATKACKAELFPVITADGLAMPAIVVNVQELVTAGIERVIIVVQPEDLPAFTRLFKEKVSPGNYAKLSPAMKKVANSLLELGNAVEFVVQEKQEGFGHAVAVCEAAVGLNPFLVVLSDHVYRSNRPDENCAAQLLAAFQRDMTPVIGLKESPAGEVSAFGCATGVWLDAGHEPHPLAGATVSVASTSAAAGSSEEGGGGGGAGAAPTSAAGGVPPLAHDHPRLLNVTQLAEKPSVEYARRHLGGMPLLEDDVFLTSFGMYVVTPSIFRVLQYQMDHNIRVNGEIQFTTALETLRRNEGLHGYLVDGERFDLGKPDRYFEALTAFQSRTPATGSPRGAAAAVPAAAATTAAGLR